MPAEKYRINASRAPVRFRSALGINYYCAVCGKVILQTTRLARNDLLPPETCPHCGEEVFIPKSWRK